MTTQPSRVVSARSGSARIPKALAVLSLLLYLVACFLPALGGRVTEIAVGWKTLVAGIFSILHPLYFVSWICNFPLFFFLIRRVLLGRYTIHWLADSPRLSGICVVAAAIALIPQNLPSASGGATEQVAYVGAYVWVASFVAWFATCVALRR